MHDTTSKLGILKVRQQFLGWIMNLRTALYKHHTAVSQLESYYESTKNCSGWGSLWLRGSQVYSMKTCEAGRSQTESYLWFSR